MYIYIYLKQAPPFLNIGVLTLFSAILQKHILPTQLRGRLAGRLAGHLAVTVPCHVLSVECADQCKVCDTAGVGKCDPGHCNTKFTFVANTQTCERKSHVLCIIFLYMDKNTVLVHQYKKIAV